jgi:hypothetical protein
VFASGKIMAGAAPAPGFVYISVFAGVTLRAAINADGTFAAALPTSGLAAGTHLVTFSYPASANYSAATALAKFVVH